MVKNSFMLFGSSFTVRIYTQSILKVSFLLNIEFISNINTIFQLFYSSFLYTNTFIQILSTKLPEHTIINTTDNCKLSNLNSDALTSDLRELRKIFKECLNEQIITIPRIQWNDTRIKLVSNIVYYYSIFYKYLVKNQVIKLI